MKQSFTAEESELLAAQAAELKDACDKLVKDLCESGPVADIMDALRGFMDAFVEVVSSPDFQDFVQAVKDVQDIPVRDPLPRPPEKLGQCSRTVYCRKRRPTARSNCR